VEEVNTPERPRVDEEAEEVHALERPRTSGEAEGELILRHLGAAPIIQWNTLPTKLQRELFDNAGAKGELLDTATVRAQTAASCTGARTAPTEPPSGPSWQAIEEDPPK
jgi:hypothetical protein